MELKRDEIIKALECWTKNFDGKVTDFVTLCNALSLINELTEENERLRAEKEAGNKELFHKWKKIADETADRFEMLYQDAKASLISNTVREMQGRLTDFFLNDDTVKYIEVDAEYINEQINHIAEEMLETKSDD